MNLYNFLVYQMTSHQIRYSENAYSTFHQYQRQRRLNKRVQYVISGTSFNRLLKIVQKKYKDIPSRKLSRPNVLYTQSISKNFTIYLL